MLMFVMLRSSGIVSSPNTGSKGSWSVCRWGEMRYRRIVTIVIGVMLVVLLGAACESEEEKSRAQARLDAVEIAEGWVLPDGFEVVEVRDWLGGIPKSGKDAGGWGTYGYFLSAPEGLTHQEIAFVLDEMVLAAGGDTRTHISSDRRLCEEDYSRTFSWSGNFSANATADFRVETFESRGGPSVSVLVFYDYSGGLFWPEEDVVSNPSSPLCPPG